MDVVEANVLIVDDHAGFRRSARDMLESAGFCVVAEAGTLVSARHECTRVAPDIVLLDIRLPDGSGFDLAEELAALGPRPVVVLISSRDRHDYGTRVDSCRAVAFIPKHQLTAEVLDLVTRGHL
jgi:DNA-binding NarL/FixJ family response regulator